MKLVIFLGAVLLAGCGTAPPAPQTVYVPVHTPCVKNEPVAPVYKFDKLPLDAPAGAKVLALARDWLAGRKYEGELEAALAGCVQDTPQ
ncbi:hypothetical protein [Duganella phyllosphaerae]|uniref:Lipoprotein n=1 Tax=Duganella phyllosphaerae TaxID=762836 RepID=A0A1E7X6X0_9BURK|nr:hypothetical protein [Duganella phyllosphaerae]OFA08839.1 hypothetical protein DUPY_04460 [Duganella phyllosphaerae]